MAWYRGKRSTGVGEIGSPPGHLAGAEQGPLAIKLAMFDTSRLELSTDVTLERVRELYESPERPRITWIDVRGRPSEAELTIIGDAFGVPKLALEDVVHGIQRPKHEIFDEGRFTVLRYARGIDTIDLEMLAVFTGRDFLVTFTREPTGPLDVLHERLLNPAGPMRAGSVDYMLYRIVDVSVDSLFLPLELMSQRLHEIEDECEERPNPKRLHDVHALRRDLRLFIRAAMPLRDAVALLPRDKRFFRKNTLPYLRDVRDHAVQLLELAKQSRDTANDVRDLIMSGLNLRLNQAMRLLTAVSTIFIPLSFIASIYGMNFDNMPELHHPNGYFIVLGVMGVVGLGLGMLFLRQAILGDAPTDRE
jgi:magnesium transporter